MIDKAKKSLPLIAVILGIFAFLMLFCPAVCIESEEFGNYMEDLVIGIRGVDVVFGFEMLGEDILDFSFMGFVTFAMPLVACICLFLAESKQDKRYAYAAIVCFLVGAICMFCLPSFMAWSNKKLGDEIKEEADLSLATTTIYGAIACLLAALCAFKSKEDCVAVQEEQ